MAAAGWSELPRDLLRLIANVLIHILMKLGSHVFVLHGGLYCQLFAAHIRGVCYLLKKQMKNMISTIVYTKSMRIFIVYTIKSSTALRLAIGFEDLPTVENELEPYDDGCIGTAFCVHRGFLEKVILSSSPSKANCMVAAICGRKCNYLAYCKLGDESWTCIVKGMMEYDDATFDHEQKFLYAVTFTNHVHVFDLFASPKLNDTIEPPLSQIEGNLLNRYLVKTSMGLLQVQRHLSLQCEWEDQTYDCYQTSFFNLYMFEPSSRSWCKVGNIGENVLFLGQNSSISIVSSCLHGYKGNHIYFIDRLLVFDMVRVRGERYDIGVYNLDSTSVKSLQRSDIKRYRWPTPIWYIHSPEDFFEQ
ncbi:putative nuclear pore membrane glycoprotein-like [Capsicum annuum]|uniref:KIB1-4 beta-propeller domain-containing protein n=1 Tax=Capsicum annuum TaxID=4072 RepID=A0A2G3A775_CAPAN|nr:putative nuclear pore membrane glycoprotein-like [Capsicum annuum]KAF3631371.1 putative nuclear pore membrane glycoprotein-like [Capsicum annuum]PHT90051.1 hypothetical protein T459_05164 [Capsicum annuum]